MALTPIGQILVQALRQHQAGNLVEARRLYQQVLSLDPRQPDALRFLGLIELQVGQHQQAVELISRAVAVQPNQPAAHFDLGSALRATGRLDESNAALRRSLALNPGSADALALLGQNLLNQQKLAMAEDCCRSAIARDPRHAAAWTTLAAAQLSGGKIAEAAQSFGHATQLDPRNAFAMNGLGCTLQLLKRPLEAEAAYRRSLQLDPSYAPARSNLAAHLQVTGKLDEAETLLREAVRVHPELAPAHLNLGGVLQAEGKLEEALASFAAADRLSPQTPSAASNRLLCLNYLPTITTAELAAEHERWAARFAPAQLPIDSRNPRQFDRATDRPLRVGYVSADFASHPLFYFIEPILRCHDRRQAQAICYADVPSPDARTASLKSLAVEWHDVVQLDDARLAERIGADRIDILVDLTGHTGRTRTPMFAAKPAPIAVSYLGYPFTTGVKAIDYRLTDAIADPPGERSFYAETLVRLPQAFCCYAPDPAAPAVGPLPALSAGKVTFGSLHTLARLNHDVLKTWCEILRAAPESRLLVFRDTLRGRVADDLRRFFADEKISPDRVDLRHDSRDPLGYLNVYQQVDVLLDTFPWSGHTTCCHALWMGVPVITLRGERYAGRMMASILTHLGQSDWIAEDRQDYIRRAVAMARDVPALVDLRATLRQRMTRSRVCDAAGFTRALESVYRQMWRAFLGAHAPSPSGSPG